MRLRVESEWRRAFGQEYFGSRDIDLVYLVEPGWSKDEFRASAAGQAPRRIKEAGYKPLGSFRFGIILDKDGKVLRDEPRSPPAIRGQDFDTPDRTKDDKAVKDLCDLYALSTYGGATMIEIRRVVHRHLPEAATLVNEASRSEHLDAAAQYLDVGKADIVARVAPIAIPPRRV